MTKTLRITSIIAAIAAVVLFIFPAVFGSRTDTQVEEFLNSPGVVENFKKSKAGKTSAQAEKVSPLVKQAQAFALYLNPPPKPKPKKTASPAHKPRPTPRPMGLVTAKFEVLGTSYYPLRPELSLALIDEPGKGLRWVRQSSKVGHLLVEQIKDGVVVVRDGDRTYELAPERPLKTSLIKGESPTASRTGSKAKTTEGAERQPSSIAVQQPQPTIEELEDANQFFKTMDAIIKLEKAGISERNKELLDKLMKSGRISNEEAKSLDFLGRQLKDAEKDPNGTGNTKVEKTRPSSRIRRRRR